MKEKIIRLNKFVHNDKGVSGSCTEREICKHDPSKKVAEMRSSGSPALDPNWVTGFVDGEGGVLSSYNTYRQKIENRVGSWAWF